MSSSKPIAEPQQAHDTILSISPSSFEIESVTGSGSASCSKLRLALLQPLAQPRMLEACRDPSSRILHTHPSRRTNETPVSENLDLTALDKAWRRAISELSPTAAIVFDLSLPKPEAKRETEAEPKVETVTEESHQENDFQRIYWTVSAPGGNDAITVELRQVMRIAVTIASTTRVRVPRGEEVQFDVVFNEEDRPSVRGVELLKKQLEVIAQSPDPQSSGSQLAETANS
ncbi:hypothetical protein F5Y16DRAFT_275892 [Xylariaceae sp. FL0255]|nr:hypothetical protein F5Y16DRAFT_275892 [Xylariaceae sp. FL0255]